MKHTLFFLRWFDTDPFSDCAALFEQGGPQRCDKEEVLRLLTEAEKHDAGFDPRWTLTLKEARKEVNKL